MQVGTDTVEEFWTSATVAGILNGPLPTDPSQALANSLSQAMGPDSGTWVFSSSGRVLLRRAFESLAARGRATTVLAPSFTCGVVEESIRQAGAGLRTYDLMEPNGRYDADRVSEMLSSPDVGAIVVTHLFGVPSNLVEIITQARDKGVLVVEDCAHLLSLSSHSPAGRLGDVAVFSFNYDKPISLGWGGAALVRNEMQFPALVRHADEVASATQERVLLEQFRSYLQARRAQISRKPNQTLARLRIRRPPRFDLPEWGVGPLRAELARWQLERLSEVQQVRNRNAEFLLDGLDPDRVWHRPEGVPVSWLKLKVGFDTPDQATRISSALQRNGLRAGRFNWSKPIGNPADSPVARATAERFIDVPVHQNLSTIQLEALRLALQ